MLLASVQVAHLHELLLADVVHHVLQEQKQSRNREKWFNRLESDCAKIWSGGGGVPPI